MHAALHGPDTLWLLAAEPARDAVHARDTEAALVRRYGRAHVRRDSVPGAEGEMFFGTVLFPDDSTRTLYIYWAEAHPFTHVDAIRTGPDATAWVVWPGVALGTRLGTVERLNGRAFHLFGFEWDYGGNVVDWRAGRLGAAWGDTRPGGRLVNVRFNSYGPTRGVSGEGTYSSALPAMRRADARVGVLDVQAR